MQVHLVRAGEDRFEALEREWGRKLTPPERRWLLLADQVLARAQKDSSVAMPRSMAA